MAENQFSACMVQSQILNCMVGLHIRNTMVGPTSQHQGRNSTESFSKSSKFSAYLF